MNIGGIVIVYNPDDLDALMRNVATYVEFVDRLFIVDNSDDLNQDLIRRMPDNCEYHSMRGNVGIAAALNFGMDRCKALGCEWVLTMDQDTAFDSGLEGYLAALENVNCEETVILSPFSSVVCGDVQVVEAEKVIQSGALINLAAFFEVGRFKSEYFIDYVDYEFCKRAKSLYGFKIFTLSNVKLRHENGTWFNGRICGLRYKYKFSSPIRMYYQLRNGLDYTIRYKDWKQISVLMKLLGKTLLVAGDKRLRFRYLLHGLQDYRNAKMGKYEVR